MCSVVGMCLVKVLRSEKEGVEVGDYMYGMTHWELYTVQPYLEGGLSSTMKQTSTHIAFRSMPERRFLVPRNF